MYFFSPNAAKCCFLLQFPDKYVVLGHTMTKCTIASPHHFCLETRIASSKFCINYFLSIEVCNSLEVTGKTSVLEAFIRKRKVFFVRFLLERKYVFCIFDTFEEQPKTHLNQNPPVASVKTSLVRVSKMY